MKKILFYIFLIVFCVQISSFAETRIDGGKVDTYRKINYKTDADTTMVSQANSFVMGRCSTAATAGKSLTIQSGGATSGSTNQSAGSLIFKTGTSTGNATASILFYAPNPVGSSGTTDNEPDLIFQMNNLFGGGYTNASLIPMSIQSASSAYLRFINSTTDADDFFISCSTANKMRFLQVSEPASTTNEIANWDAVRIAASGTEKCFIFSPFVLQSGTAGYTGIELNVTETSTGSGTKLLADLQVGSSSKFAIDNTGAIYTPLFLSPSTTQSIVAGTGITSAMFKPIIRIAGSGGPVDITANPQIADGTDGQVIVFQGDSDTNTVKFDNGTGISLNSGANCVLGQGDTLILQYDSGDDTWYQLTTSREYIEVEKTIESPDTINNVRPIFHADAKKYPNGVKLVNVQFTISANAAYVLPFEEWSSAMVKQNDIETLSTDASHLYAEAEDGDIDDSDIDADDYVIVHFPSTDIGDYVTCKIIYYPK